MTLSHNSSRLFSNPDYKHGGFTPPKFQEGLMGLGDDSDLPLNPFYSSQDQISGNVVGGASSLMTGTPVTFLNSLTNPNNAGSSTTALVLAGGLVLLVVALAKNGR